MKTSEGFYISLQISKEITKKPAFSPSNRNLLKISNEKREKIKEKIEKCGTEFAEFIRKDTSEIVEFLVYCDNRICQNEGCQDHREYKFKKQHREQEKALKFSMKSPKHWIFTTERRLRLEEIDVYRVRSVLSKLFKLLKDQSLTEFSVHLEYKFHSDNSVFIHFHVVCGGLKDYRYCVKRWGAHIRYQNKIDVEQLGYYVSKYASKVPKLYSEYQREKYLDIAYKEVMHRFSAKEDVEVFPSEYIRMEDLRREIKNCLYRDSYKNAKSEKRRYHSFLEVEPPPEINLENFGLKIVEKLNLLEDISIDQDPNYIFEPVGEKSKKLSFKIDYEKVDYD